MKTKNMIKFLTAFILAALIVAPNLALSQEDEEEGFTFGGAVRYNIFNKSWVDSKTQPEFTWDTWRLNVDGSMAGVDLSFEYRFYPTFGTHFIHHGFLGYDLSDNLYMELGVTQVPFGITTYASHSWWFQGPYYVGLEDDYDMGINFDYTGIENMKLSFSYFRQAEPEGPIYGGDVTFGQAGPGRYSYDLTAGKEVLLSDNDNNDEISEGDEVLNASTRELNQFNFRGAYNISEDWQIGVSAQVGGIYNDYLDEMETSTVFAGHLVGNFGGFNLKTEYIKYNYKAKGAVIENYDTDNEQVASTRTLDVVQMGAYGFNDQIAAEASLYVVGLAYSIDVDWGPISNIQPYVDYTLIDKAKDKFYDTEQLVPGMLVTAGSIYTYVDYAMGKNHSWFNGSQAEITEDSGWNSRFNINIGYYF
jgi:hypothetical protein